MNPLLKPSLTVRVFIIYYIVGLIGLGIPQSRELFITLMPFSLLLSMTLLLIHHKGWRYEHVVIIALIAILGYLVEVVGVLTGEVFGEYTYGRALGVKLFDTPLMIGINWIMLIYCVHTMFENLKWPWWTKVLTGASIMVVYDIIMEPVAIRLDMWSWGGGDIPIQNYIAWFVISLVFLAMMNLSKIKTHNQVAAWLFGVQTAFFLVLNVIV
jgi:bisanhydrobacterioruberin hydratase